MADRIHIGITFEEILFHIENGDVLDILKHPNQTRYEGRYIFVVAVSAKIPYGSHVSLCTGLHI
jgi:hypothetical protein